MTAAAPTTPVRFHRVGQLGPGQDMSYGFRMIGIEEIQGVPTGRPPTRLDRLRMPPPHHGANLPRVLPMRPQSWVMAENAPEPAAIGAPMSCRRTGQDRQHADGARPEQRDNHPSPHGQEPDTSQHQNTQLP
jgi:hypothetical protein